jgi:hypothetical protein
MSDQNYIDPQGEIFNYEAKRPLDYESLKFFQFFTAIFSSHSATLRLTDEVKANLFRHHIMGEDFEQWNRFIFKLNNKFGIVSDYLAQYRIH